MDKFRIQRQRLCTIGNPLYIASRGQQTGWLEVTETTELAATGSGRPDEAQGGENTAVLTRPKPKTSKPPMYKVILINDDYTPMEFVVYVLQRFFSMPSASAVQLMLKVHQSGSAVVGVFAREIAETKVKQVTDLARANEHPLLCTMEKE